MLENLDIETNKFEEEEENKINDLERKKNLYLDHAEKMSKKTRGKSMQRKFERLYRVVQGFTERTVS